MSNTLFSLQETVVVPDPGQASRRTTRPTRGRSRSSDSAPQQGTASQSGTVPTTRVAHHERTLRQKGYSQEAANRIAHHNAPATKAAYDCQWNIYVRWCEASGKDEWLPSPPQICDFLLHLHRIERAPHTIETYKCVIGKTLEKQGLPNASLDSEIRRLLDNLYREHAQQPKVMPPQWDLNIVLGILREEPFEPVYEEGVNEDTPQKDYKVSLQHLTWKTVFLLLLATGARRGEIHALLRKGMRNSPNWNSVSFKTDPKFIAKTQVRTRGATAVPTLEVKGLGHFLGPDLYPYDKTLCPVRCIKMYLLRTKTMSLGKSKLFIPYKASKVDDIGVNTITGWIRQLIKHCYINCDENLARSVNTSTHAIRGIAATMAWKGGAVLEDVLSQCHWQSSNMFVQYYLKPDLWLQEESTEGDSIPRNRLRIITGGKLA